MSIHTSEKLVKQLQMLGCIHCKLEQVMGSGSRCGVMICGQCDEGSAPKEAWSLLETLRCCKTCTCPHKVDAVANALLIHHLHNRGKPGGVADGQWVGLQRMQKSYMWDDYRGSLVASEEAYHHMVGGTANRSMPRFGSKHTLMGPHRDQQTDPRN